MSKPYMALFAGAGGACLGAVATGYTPICAVEYDPYAAALYRTNFGSHVREENILDTPIEQLPDFDFLWASNPCPSFSSAKTDGEETELDIALAGKVASIIRAKKPRYFALENVRGYLGSLSYGIIFNELESLGYNTHAGIYDVANYGIPQNRVRLILRASRDRLQLLQPTHAKTADLFHQQWNGWYNAIADLLPSCNPTHLTEKQIQSLENKGWIGSALVEGKDSPSRDRTIRKPEEPCMTITANSGGGGRLPKVVLIDGKGNNYGSSYTIIDGEAPSFTVTANMDRNITRAVIIERTGYGDRGPTQREATEPIWTIRSAVGCDERGGYRSPVTALLDEADVRALDYRCLARFQSFPDSYKWGNKKGGNCRAIGNAVPVLFAQKVIESMVNYNEIN